MGNQKFNTHRIHLDRIFFTVVTDARVPRWFLNAADLNRVPSENNAV